MEQLTCAKNIESLVNEDPKVKQYLALKLEIMLRGHQQRQAAQVTNQAKEAVESNNSIFIRRLIKSEIELINLFIAFLGKDF